MDEQKVINDAIRTVLDMLEPINHYPYHNINHTLDVYNRAAYLCDRELVNQDEKNDILLAALFHDTGFARRYEANEAIGAEIAGVFLARVGWDEQRIARIQRIIMSTVLFSPATDILDCIMKDADMDNLGRNDFLLKNMLFQRELQVIQCVKIDHIAWLKQSRTLLEKFNFLTPTSQRERENSRREHILKIEARLNKLSA